MAVRIRLARHGAKKRPYYRVVVADARARRDGRFIEQVGRYNPVVDPVFVQLDLERIDAWVKQGAQPTERVSFLIEKVRSGALANSATATAAAAPAEPEAAADPAPEPEPAAPAAEPDPVPAAEPTPDPEPSDE